LGYNPNLYKGTNMKQQPADYLSELFGANIGNVVITFEQCSEYYDEYGYTHSFRTINLEFSTDDVSLLLSKVRFCSIILASASGSIGKGSSKVIATCVYGKETNELLRTLLN